MTARHFILATAGHVDHGKSTLVKRLTGIDPDRLPEEKARGMTIDLGFAAFSPSPTLSIGIVDVPGHEDFVKNMVTGVGAINAVLFVVAADDGWMPQSEEHLQILEYLGVRHGVIAVTKMDHVDPMTAEKTLASIREKLAGTFLDQASIIPISHHSPDGVARLTTAVTTLFDRMPTPPDVGRPRLHIDRSFQLQGVGRIVAGTLAGGMIGRGQTVVVTPNGAASRIRGIQSHGRDSATAEPGSRVALNLSNLPADVELRGQTITLAELAATNDVLDVMLLHSVRLPTRREFRRGVAVRVHHGTRSIPANVFPYPGDTARPRLAQLRLASPLLAFVGDRIVLRDAAQRHTLGGAVVLDSSARRGGMQRADRIQYLSECTTGLENAVALISAIVDDRRIVDSATVLRQSPFGDMEIRGAIESTKASGRLLERGKFLIRPDAWQELLASLDAQIRKHHRDYPEQSGLPVTALAKSVTASMDVSLLDFVVDDLRPRGFTRLQTVIRHSEHQPALPTRLQAAGNRIRSVLSARPLDPPPRSELTPDELSRQAMTFLKLSGEVVELSQLISISAAAFAQAEQIVRRSLGERGRATATELKAAMGTSRRVAIPLLEKLDQLGVTRRQGDLRQLRV